MQQGDEAGDLVGFGCDVGLAQDCAGGDVVGGEQVGLGAVGPDGTADGLSVDGDVPPVQPPGGCFGPQPGAHLRVGGLSVDRADRPLDRLVAGRHVPAEPRVVPDPAAAQRFLRHRLRELGGGQDGVRAAQPGDHDHHQDRGQVMPPALGLAVVGDLRQVLQQPALPADPEPVEVRRPAPGQHWRVEPRGQRRDPARGQLIQPACLRLTVKRVVVTAAAAAVPGGRPDRSEIAGRVHRPGLGGRVGERLRRHQPHPERRQVIPGQRPQHRAQRPRPGMAHRGGGRQHAQPLVRAHPLQPRRPLPVIPPDVPVADREPPRRRSERPQHKRHPAGLRDVAQHPARRRHPQRMMLFHQRVVPGHLIGADKTDSQLTGIISLISHPAGIPETHEDV